MAGHAVPRQEFPAGLLSDDENLDKILSRLAKEDEDQMIQELTQNNIKTHRRGVKYKAQQRDFAIRRGIENRKPIILKQQNLFCKEVLDAK